MSCWPRAVTLRRVSSREWVFPRYPSDQLAVVTPPAWGYSSWSKARPSKPSSRAAPASSATRGSTFRFHPASSNHSARGVTGLSKPARLKAR